MNQIVHQWKRCVCLFTGTTNLAWNSSHYIVNSLLKSTSIITGDSIIKALISPKAFWAEYLFKHIVIELIMKISWYRDFLLETIGMLSQKQAWHRDVFDGDFVDCKAIYTHVQSKYSVTNTRFSLFFLSSFSQFFSF
jgi:hypothetical protein